MDIEPVKDARCRGIPQALQGGTDEGGAPVAIVQKFPGRGDHQPISRDTLASGGHLAGNRVGFSLLLRRHPSVQSGWDGRHNKYSCFNQ
jgi:hypothetical protein